MAVIAKIRAGGRQLADSALTYAAGIAILTPIITTSTFVAGGLFLAGMLSVRNIERSFAGMLPCFQGTETDRNWTQRQQAVDQLRKYTKSTTPKDFPNIYFPGIKSVSDGIIKAAESLRTTLSATGCSLIKDIAVAVGPSLDPTLVEKFLQPMIALCGHTKTLNRKNGDEAVLAILGNTPITIRVLQQITASSNDIHHSTRMCTAKWLKVIIQKNGRHCEQHSGLDLIDRCIRTGLQDAKLDVRETMRDTYWTFARIWPDRAESIMSSLDVKAQKTLDAHPSKPHDVIQPETKASTSTVTPGPAKLSIKDMKFAAMRAKAAENLTPATEEVPHDTVMQPEVKATTISTVTPGPAKLSIKEMKLAAMRAKAAEKSNPAAEDSAPAADEVLPGPIPPPRSVFTVTVGGPSQPTLSAPPKRRGRTPAAVQITSMSRPATPELEAIELEATEIRPNTAPAPATAPPFATAPAPATAPPSTNAPPPATAPPPPPAPAVVQYIPLPPFQRDPVRVSAQENFDTTTHNHTWNNKEAAQKRRSISPLTRDPEEARTLLDRGIARIQSRSIDDHGYRSLQGLIVYHDRIFKDEQKFDDMLLALLDALETPNTEIRAPLGRPLDNKFQILVTIRLMFVHNRKYFAAYFPRAMSALIIARRNFEARNHIVSGLEETANDIAAACTPPDVIDAVLDVLETEERDEAGSRTVAMGLHILSGLSTRQQELLQPLERQQEQRMAKFGLKCLREPKSIVRRATIEYCLELKRLITPEARFFRLVTGNNEDLKNLITYYAANTNS